MTYVIISVGTVHKKKELQPIFSLLANRWICIRGVKRYAFVATLTPTLYGNQNSSGQFLRVLTEFQRTRINCPSGSAKSVKLGARAHPGCIRWSPCLRE
eukprot:5320108-Amphidinium_carterae.1